MSRTKLTREEALQITAAYRAEMQKVAQLTALLPPEYQTIPARRPAIYTYFVQVDFGPGEGPGPIKIGIAADVAARINQLQTACPYDLWLMGYVPGGKELEQELHRKYAHLHMRGEWFRPTEDLERDLYWMVYDYDEEQML